MKRKQVNTSPKAKQAKTPKKVLPSKIVQEDVESEEEVEVPVKKAGTKEMLKKGAKVQKVVDEPQPEDEEEEEEQGDADNEDGDEAYGEENEDDEAVEDEEDDDGEDVDDPSEELLGTEEPTIPSKVKSGKIPPSVPATKIVHINNLPKKCKQINIVEVFAKYGPIDQIHIVSPPSGTAAKVAYKTEKAALAALADDKPSKALGNISISMKKEKKKNESNRELCVFIKNIKTGTTEEQITGHFESCGEIDSVKLVNKLHFPHAFVNFTDIAAIPAALKLHNSILNDSNIRVSKSTGEHKAPHTLDTLRTVVVKNKQNFDSIEVAKLEAIFSKCGEIEYIEVVCKKLVLAFITFKTEEAAQKALKLSGETQQEIELEIETFSPTKKWTSIYVTNLPKDCSEEDLTNHFSQAGEVANTILRKGFAIVRFNDSDGYCKSFLYNETFIKGNMIFIEPHSQRKQSVLKTNGLKRKGFKRSFENGHSIFKAKKMKTENN